MGYISVAYVAKNYGLGVHQWNLLLPEVMKWGKVNKTA